MAHGGKTTLLLFGQTRKLNVKRIFAGSYYTYAVVSSIRRPKPTPKVKVEYGSSDAKFNQRKAAFGQ